MDSLSLFTLAISMMTLLLSPAASRVLSPAGGRVGINYGRIANNLPSPSQVLQLLKSQSISSAKIYNTDSFVLSAFSGSGIALTVSLPNDLLPFAADNSTFTDSWLQSNLLPFLPSTTISSIAVGNEVFTNPNPNLTSFLLPAMKNLYLSLQSRNLHTQIKISSPLSLSALDISYPPSAGAFNPSLVPSVIFPMLSFLRRTSSFLMVNVYPFLTYSANSDHISLSFALFQDNPGVVDSHNGLKYSNLFDTQIDAVYSAMSALHLSNIPVIVTETGWPSKGDANEAGATSANAAAYNRNLFRRVLNSGGTPLWPYQPLEVFISLTLSPISYNASEVAIVPLPPAAASRVRQQSCFVAKGKAEKLPRVTVQEGATCYHHDTLKNKKRNN